MYTESSLAGVEITQEKNQANFKTTLKIQMTPLRGFSVTSLPEVVKQPFAAVCQMRLGL